MTSARNPNNPTLVGEEFRPSVSDPGPNFRVASPSDGVVQTLALTSSGARAYLAAYVKMDTIGGSFVCETMPEGEETQVVTTTVLRPEAVHFVGSNPGLTSTAGSSADDIVSVLAAPAADPAAYVHNTDVVGSRDPGVQMSFATIGVFAGRRILDVRVCVVASDPLSSPYSNIVFVLEEFDPTVIRRSIGPGPVTGWGPAIQKAQVRTGEIHPIDARFWTVARLEQYDWVDDTPPDHPVFRIRAAIDGAPTGANSMQIHQAWLEVDHCPEERYTADIVYPQTTDAAWATFVPTHPDGVTTGFPKSAGGMSTVIRQARYGNGGRPSVVAADYTFFVPYIEGSNGDTDFGVTQYAPLIDSSGLVSILGTPRKDRMFGFDIQTSTPQSDPDGQGYARVLSIEPQQAGGGDPQTLTQEVSNTASDDYAGVIITVRTTNPGVHSISLIVELRRQSDDLLMATASMTSETIFGDFPDLGGGWRTVQMPFATPAALVAGTTYYLNVMQNILGGGGGFYIAALTTASSPGLERQPDGRSTYRGETDTAGLNREPPLDSSLNPFTDLAAVLYLSIDVPSGFAGIAASVDIETHDCGIAGIGYAALSWSPISPLASFAYYEVQRLDDHDSIWRTIATIRTIGTSGFYDFEGRLGDVSQYRIRTVASAGTVSNWSTPVSVTPPVDGCGYTFTSNIINAGSIGLMVAYADVYNTGRIASRTFQFPEAAEVKRQAIYGRDDYVSFIPANRRGDEFTRRLLVDALGTPPTPPPGSADPIRDLSRAPIPYVCVRDESGNRWFANVVVSEYSITQPGPFEYVTVAIGERVTVPAVADF